MTKTVAIVTGASQGIGRATAMRLAQDFSALVLVARNRTKLEETASAVREGGSEALVIDRDLAEPTAAATVVEQTLSAFGRIDALLNIAGAVPGLDVFQMTDEQWDVGLELKLHGARRLTVQAWDALRMSKGTVVFTSGNAAMTPKAAAAAVGAINACIEALAKAFAERGIVDDVQVNCVSPGAIMTDRRTAMLERAAAAKEINIAEAKQSFLKQAGIARFGTAEEIADLMAFAVSPAAHWMTGTVLRMDGGEIRSV
ncbi:Short-chain reductase protein NovJ [Methylobacterium crusticola]|uniref:Short-chain reductase protein NovJ n=1 Tax=Methylobacterium crusticola TaxID=1697972 RepID=A0ABQ4R8M9_9HYPH|nr:SDR family oxidoreductase [Methylobacterium crusticola]GJD53564.1 Short-chain reductase protein NovJ [Methylobacterium crusticola]